MRRYESVWVVNGDLPEEEAKATIDKFTRIISTQGGVLVGVDEWGRRKLAYKIQGTTRGYYVVADFAGLPGTVKELERNYRIDDRIIRYHTLKKADKVNLEALQAEMATRARAVATSSAPVPEAEAVAAAGPPETGAPAPEAVAPPEAVPMEEAAPAGETALVEKAASAPEAPPAPDTTPAPVPEE
jgi:small subunit ribosomal protein S6